MRPAGGAPMVSSRDIKAAIIKLGMPTRPFSFVQTKFRAAVRQSCETAKDGKSTRILCVCSFTHPNEIPPCDTPPPHNNSLCFHSPTHRHLTRSTKEFELLMATIGATSGPGNVLPTVHMYHSGSDQQHLRLLLPGLCDSVEVEFFNELCHRLPTQRCSSCTVEINTEKDALNRHHLLCLPAPKLPHAMTGRLNDARKHLSVMKKRSASSDVRLSASELLIGLLKPIGEIKICRKQTITKSIGCVLTISLSLYIYIYIISSSLSSLISHPILHQEKHQIESSQEPPPPNRHVGEGERLHLPPSHHQNSLFHPRRHDNRRGQDGNARISLNSVDHQLLVDSGRPCQASSE